MYWFCIVVHACILTMHWVLILHILFSVTTVPCRQGLNVIRPQHNPLPLWKNSFSLFSTGHKECLQEARAMRDIMQKMSKTDQKARLPREWLGKEESPGIRRLVSINNISRENRKITRKETDLVLLLFHLSCVICYLFFFFFSCASWITFHAFENWAPGNVYLINSTSN